jgi:zona occludens toxin
MINAIFGRPGGGKSYEAVKYIILPSILKDKRKVVTNIPVQLDYIEKVHGDEAADLVTVVEGAFSEFGEVRPFAHPQDYLQYKDWRNEKGQGVLFVIDEAHLALGQTAKKEVTEFYSLHRHYGFDIYLVTQGHRKLNRDIRDMIEISYNCAKLEALGMNGYNRKTFHGLPDSNPAAMENRDYDSEYFPYYKSHTATNSAVTEAAAKGSTAKLNPYKKITFVVLFAGVIGVIMTLKGVLSPSIPDKEIATEQKTPVTKTAMQVNQPVAASTVGASTQELAATEYVKKELDKIVLTDTQKMMIEKKANSEKYHPFHKINLHVDGVYWDSEQDVRNVYFIASNNGQRMFDLTLKELMLSGYTVNVLADCVVELVYYDFKSFILCDLPTVGSSTVASTN